MNTRQHLEKIIIGTLLDITHHYDDVRGYITEDMFSDSTCKRIFGLITQMRAEGAELTDPSSIYQRYGESVVDIIPTMCQLCSDYSFEYMKLRFNEDAFIANELLGTSYPKTNVRFTDYVKNFINLVMEDEKRKHDDTTGAAA